jgi:hypothetical protein
MVRSRLPKFAAVAAIALVAGCAGGPSTGQLSTAALPRTAPQTLAAGRLTPQNCTPDVWVSSITGPVYGYTGAAAGVLCITLTGGGSPSVPFSQTHGLATDLAGNLYVADTNNSRVVVFDSSGVFVKVLNDIVQGQSYVPVAVAVDDFGSPKVVAVMNFCAGSGGTCTGRGNIAFFSTTCAPPVCAAATGSASSNRYSSYAFGAMDKSRNVFAGARDSHGKYHVVYVRQPNNFVGFNKPIGLANLVTVANGGDVSVPVGMFVKLVAQGLSVADETTGVATCAADDCVYTYTYVNAALVGAVANFTEKVVAPYPTVLTGLNQANQLLQVAPDYRGSTIYGAGYGSNAVYSDAFPAGGPVGTYFSPVCCPVGVATHPTGQF